MKAPLLALAGLLASPIAHATPEVSPLEVSAPRTTFGLSGGVAPGSPQRYFAGLAVSRTLTARLALGAEIGAFHVGATTESYRYACDECLVSGFSAQGFAEVGASLLGPLGVYARGSLGVALVARTRHQQADASHLEPAGKLMAGPELLLGPWLVRPYAALSMLGKDLPFSVGLELGARI